jgi:hypothetical protein
MVLLFSGSTAPYPERPGLTHADQGAGSGRTAMVMRTSAHSRA